MKVLDYNAGRNYTEYLASDAMKALKAADERMAGITNLEAWKNERSRLLKAYKDAYPKYMFKERTQVKSQLISKYEFKEYRLENHIFESYPGWYVNASVYLPKEPGVYPGIVCPTGHSSKKYPNYTGSAQLFARSGYIAVSFDPPGMQGEHHPGDEDGNNHFEDGVRSYLSGFWSQTFFILDAIRCIDYLQTRDDIDQECGFAMTGISGGGTTTFQTSILEDRLTCIAPVCCVSDEVGLTLVDRYTFCCEGKGHAHWADGIKFSTMLALSAPLPMLMCSGGKDEVLDYRLAAKTIENTKKIYALYGSDEANIFVDHESGHAYSVPMINKILGFFDKYLKQIERAEGYYHYTNDDFEHPAPEQLICGAIDTSSMYTANMDKFKNAIPRKLMKPDELASFLGIRKNIVPQKVEKAFESKPVWVHTLTGLKISVNQNTDVAALLLERTPVPSKEILVYADNLDKWRNFPKDGFLALKAAFLKREAQENECSVLSMEITGIGELKMEPGFYDLASWSSTERLFSYLAIVMGSSITAQRTMEILAVLNHLKASGDYDRIICSGKGISAVPALYASYIFAECDKVVLENLPVSYESMAEHVPNDFMPTSVIYNAPENFEIFEIANATDNITLVNPVYADMTVLDSRQAQQYYNNNVKLIFNEEGLKPEFF